MNNIVNISYIYSFYLLKILKIKNKYNNFYIWKKILKILILINKNNNFINDYFLLNKYLCLKKIYEIILLSTNIKLNIYIKKFINIILYKKKFIYIKYIYFSFIKLYKYYKNILNIIVYTKYNINKKNLFLINKFLKNNFKNKNYILKFRKNNKIIAGFKLNINDFVIDGSLINKIKNINFCF